MSVTHTYVDRGGTFTDVVFRHDDGQLTVRKIPSNRAVVGQLAEGELTFGTTVATNALLERKSVPTVLFVSRGFADLPWIRDQSRPDLFDPDTPAPKSLVVRIVEVDGRIDEDGNEVEPLALPDMSIDDIESAAVVLLNSHVNAAHEISLARRLKEVDYVTMGHECSPEVGYLGRIETAIVDAAITPLLRRAMFTDRIPPGATVIRSDGSLCQAHELRAPDAVLSGPSGGVLAVAKVAELAGFSRAIGLDMGGTSTDVCRVEVGRPVRREGESTVAGMRVRRPMLEIETIAAGGGSLLVNDGLRLMVGPRSAGAVPGPACYGKGGPQTLTDATLKLGLIDPSKFPIPLYADHVTLSATEARAYVRVARETMAQAIRRVATARGVDVTDHALVAYGGAAGQHAAEVASLLGITTVLMHPCASVLCAWGQSLARREENAVAPVWRRLSDGLPIARDHLRRLKRRLPKLGNDRETVEVRYAGSDIAIELDLSDDDTPETVRTRYIDEHRRRYGFARSSDALEIVNARVRVAEDPVETPPLDSDPWGLDGYELNGPLLLSSDTTSIWLPEGWTARSVDGLLRLDRRAHGRKDTAGDTITPASVELWGNRFQAIADEAGMVLQRLARSVNIRERRDFSCAIFDEQGQLVANAPHVPVHLGSMGETVRDLLLFEPELPAGHAWATNAPSAGGSHLPDITVITPVEHEGTRWFVASRGHHADVGGLTPGSMPPHSKTLADEGILMSRVRLTTADGELRDLSELLGPSRLPDIVSADIEAQIASNTHAAALLKELGAAETTSLWMKRLREVSARAVRRLLDRLQTGRSRDDLDGIPVQLELRRDGDRLAVDFTGTGGPHHGNLNAPVAVTRAAVLYALRVLVGEDIPLNEGCLEVVDLTIPAPSILSPPADAAVVAGNVETSQRIADLFFRAARARAASCGTMNNLVIAGDGWSFYETIGGGLGATRDVDGASARQVHMTNTRITDPEVLEARFPVRIRRFSSRPKSGGLGRKRGGNGVVREIELTAPATATLIAAWRPMGAAGEIGGERGAPGKAQIFDGQWHAWDGSEVHLHAGSRIRIETPGGGGWGTATASDRRG